MSYRHQYRIRDDRLGLHVQALREQARLTQAEIAHRLGVSERTIQHWEAGTAYPAIANLKKLIEVYLCNGAFSPGSERDEAKALWDQVAESAPHYKGSFDESWFLVLLDRMRPGPVQSECELLQGQPPSRWPLPRIDWGEAFDVSVFYGRETELLTLERWAMLDTCRLITLLGMGGVGKSALSIKLVQRVAPHFDCILWRSLCGAPSLEELLADCLHVLPAAPLPALPPNTEQALTLLLALLSQRRCLLVLDGVETLLQPGSLEGRYREGYEPYATLLQRIALTPHRSCLLITSRELPCELEPLAGMQAPVQVLKLSGMGRAHSQELLKEKGLSGTPREWDRFVARYSGNPQALKMAAALVCDLFGGDLMAFLHEGPVTPLSLQHMLEQQLQRLSPLELDIMYRLAFERKPVALEVLSAVLFTGSSKRELLAALQALHRRCLLERREPGAIFTLQPVVMEYIGERLAEKTEKELIGRTGFSHGMISWVGTRPAPRASGVVSP
jgi:transcriptional regulator with XRE-family HTH domain